MLKNKRVITFFSILIITSIASVNGCINIKNTGDSLISVKNEIDISLTTETGDIYGTLLLPIKKPVIPVALIIAGSGPIDRNGNNPQMENNSLKMLAEGLLEENIASLRYDKRGIGESKEAGLDESALRFEDYINDAIGWITMLKTDDRFSEVIIIGHSEGSLIGMIATNQGEADAFISIAGTGKSAGELIKEQLKTQPQQVIDLAYPIIDSLSSSKTVENIPPFLFSLFRPSVQPYMISWMKYDPVLEIKKLTIPTLILQGSTDIQVSLEDANLLSNANDNSKLEIINGMNHIFKEVESDLEINLTTYNNPNLPIMIELQESIVRFIKRK